MAYQARRFVEADQPDDASPTPPAVAARRVKGLRARPAAQSAVGLVALAVLVTSGVIVLGVNGGSAAAAGAGPSATMPAPSLQARALSADPMLAPATAAAAVMKTQPGLVSVTRLYSTGSLNVRAEADTESELVGSIGRGTKVSATSTIEGKYRRIQFEDGYGWVLAASLSDEADSPVASGTTMAACPRGSAVERGLRAKTIYIYRSVCELFPEINSVGGMRRGGLPFHKNGRALDLMLTTHVESELGWRITKYLIAHQREFTIDHIIFEQQIWTPGTQRWRKMADRGSLNANHFNHVHVAIKA